MKNLLLLLLLANILYFMYSAIRGDEERRGEILVEESQLGPQLQLADNRPAEPDETPVDAEPEVLAPTGSEDGDAFPATENETPEDEAPEDEAPETVDESEAVDAPMPVDEPAPRNELQAAVGRSCVTVGAFVEREDADRALLSFVQKQYEVTMRSAIGEIVKSHWVHIRDIPTTEEAETMLETLARGGFGEAYKIETEDDGIKITIGFFGKRDGAERVELQVASLGLQPVVQPNVGEGTVYFVDVALPVGTGAQSIIEQYGEERVALRDAAICPNGA